MALLIDDEGGSKDFGMSNGKREFQQNEKEEESTAAESSSTLTTIDDAATTASKLPCCFYWKFGVCDPPRPPCRFDHDMEDDGTTPCCFGATCRLGHRRRVTELKDASYEQRAAYWTKVHHKSQQRGENGQPQQEQSPYLRPAQRDATQLQSQLEPWSTATLRDRLVNVFHGNSYQEMDGLPRNIILERVLQCYQERGYDQLRKRIYVRSPHVVRTKLLDALQQELVAWRDRHGHYNNTRPSINAQSYMILRKDSIMANKSHHDPNEAAIDDNGNDETKDSSDSEPQPQVSRKIRQAHKRMQRHQSLWELAFRILQETVSEVDPDFVYRDFSALAVTYNFQGSPHIDKQNIGPFYGLSLGNFKSGQGGICVEAAWDTVAVCDSKHRLVKVDGRYPHWVDEYETDEGEDGTKTRERYSLIYYATTPTTTSNTGEPICHYEKPSKPFFGEIVHPEETIIKL